MGFPEAAFASVSTGPFSGLDHARVDSWQGSLWTVAHCSGILVCKYLSKDGHFPIPQKNILKNVSVFIVIFPSWAQLAHSFLSVDRHWLGVSWPHKVNML